MPISAMPDTPAPARPAPGARAPGRAGSRARGWRRPRRPALAAAGWLALVAAAWLVPLATHLVRVDWLLPVIAVAALVGLQRAGVRLLDRVVCALVVAFAAVCVLALPLSVTRWGLHPVLVAGTGFTLIVAAAHAGRRTPAPGRVASAGDVAVLVAAAAAAGPYIGWFATRDLGARIGALVHGEDMARHFLLFDTIDRLGGYAFLRDGTTGPASLDPGMRAYPQGVHLGYALLDRCLRSAATGTGGPQAFDTLLWLYVATFALLALSVLWSVRRVAGPGVATARLVPVLAVVAGWLALGEPARVFLRGYPNELVGLALAAVLTAVVARPLPVAADQLATVTALVVGIAFGYHLFLPYALAVAAVWAWRRRLWRQRAALAVAVLAAPLVLVVPVLNLSTASTSYLVLAGTALRADRPALLLLVALAAGGLVLGRGLRSPARRAVGLALAAAIAGPLALGALQLATVGHTVYYFDKLLHLTVVVALVALGGWARLVPLPRSGPRVGAVPRRWLVPVGAARLRRPVVGAVVALLVALAGGGGPGHTRPGADSLRLLAGVDPGSPGAGRDALLMAHRHADGDPTVDVDLMGNPYRNWYATMFAAMITRTYGPDSLRWYAFLTMPSPPRTMQDLQHLVEQTSGRVRLYLANPDARMLVGDRQHPRPPAPAPGGNPDDYGDPDAPTNLQAALLLAQRYPDTVEVVIVPARPLP